MKLKTVFILVIALWLAAGTKLVTEKIYHRERNLREAFAAVNSGLTESTLNVVGELGSRFLTEKDKVDLIKFLSGRIGLTIDSKMTTVIEPDREEVAFQKNAKACATTIKVVSIPVETEWRHYFIANLVISGDGNDSIAHFRELLTSAGDELDCEKVESTMQLKGVFSGNLSAWERDRIAEKMLKKLKCKVVFESRQTEPYEVYGYCTGRNEYIEWKQTKVNVQLSMYYDKEQDCTVVFLSSPGELSEHGGNDGVSGGYRDVRSGEIESN